MLAAGALRTPQLLMLSGIGPAEQLREYGMDVVRDLPAVGVGLQDHPAVPVPFRVEDEHALHGPAVEDDTLARRGPGGSRRADRPCHRRSAGPRQPRNGAAADPADPADPPVVDPAYLSQQYDRERVHGLKGLWVVDASVLPRITRAHPQATVIAVAERAAELIDNAIDGHDKE